MPEEIVSRMLRLPGSAGISGWDTDEAAHTLTLTIRQTAGEPYDVWGGRDLAARDPQLDGAADPGSALGDMDRVAAGGGASRPLSPLCRADRTAAFVEGKVHYTARLETAVAQDCEAAPVSRGAAQRRLPAETVRRMDKRVRRRRA